MATEKQRGRSFSPVKHRDLSASCPLIRPSSITSSQWGLFSRGSFLFPPQHFLAGMCLLENMICTLIQIPIALSAVWLSTALPRSGGDYVFQSRVFGGGMGLHHRNEWVRDFDFQFGARTLRLAGRRARPGALFFWAFGPRIEQCRLDLAGLWVTTPQWAFSISLLKWPDWCGSPCSGFKNYVRFQHIVWGTTLLGFAATSACTICQSSCGIRVPRRVESICRRGRRSCPNFHHKNALAAAQTAGVETAAALGISIGC